MVAKFIAEWLRNLIIEIPLWPKPMPLISIHCDSETTLFKPHSQIYNGKSRHIGLCQIMSKFGRPSYKRTHKGFGI